MHTRQESNLRPLVLETSALPAELLVYIVAREGVEPPYRGPKPRVLPLDDRAIIGRLVWHG